MSDFDRERIEALFHPRSIAIVGVTLANPEHWTRVYLNSLVEFGFEGPIYLVNPKGGEIRGLKVYPSIADIPDTVDYVISIVPAKASPELVQQCANKGVKGIHFCTAGFNETGDEEGARLEAELTRLSRTTGIRIIGPNCMGIYCPQSRLSFGLDFPKDSGQVGFISQSGGNAISLVREAMWRGVRFSKVISYGNACDLNESDFLEYLSTDSATKIIAIYIEGLKDGTRFRQALEKATRRKTVVLLKGGITRGGARAVSGHTGALAGAEVSWDALSRQLPMMRVRTLEELADVLVTLTFIPMLKGRNVGLIGSGGGASVMLTDQFEQSGLRVPPLPEGLVKQIRDFTPIAGNILGNPVDYGQSMVETDKLAETIGIVSAWTGIDFLIGFIKPSQHLVSSLPRILRMTDGVLKGAKSII